MKCIMTLSGTKTIQNKTISFENNFSFHECCLKDKEVITIKYFQVSIVFFSNDFWETVL